MEDYHKTTWSCEDMNQLYLEAECWSCM